MSLLSMMRERCSIYRKPPNIPANNTTWGSSTEKLVPIATKVRCQSRSAAMGSGSASTRITATTTQSVVDLLIDFPPNIDIRANDMILLDSPIVPGLRRVYIEGVSPSGRDHHLVAVGTLR